MNTWLSNNSWLLCLTAADVISITSVHHSYVQAASNSIQDLSCDAVERSSVQEFVECSLSKVFLRVRKERTSKVKAYNLGWVYIFLLIKIKVIIFPDLNLPLQANKPLLIMCV